jgi:hypothetical protein
MTLLEAIRADREGQIEKAAMLYEEALSAGERDPGAFLNLAILYWQATDYGFSTEKRLDPEFVVRAGTRLQELFRDASRAYPENAELEFWRKYIAWADLGEEFPIQDCRQLMFENPTVLTPAMYIFAQSQGREMRDEAVELLQKCREDGSTRAQYVVSVVEGVMKRSAWANNQTRE